MNSVVYVAASTQFMLTGNDMKAIAKFHWAMLKDVGFWLSYEATTDLPEFEDLPLSEELKNPVDEDKPGFAAMSTEGWYHVPYT